MIGQFSACGIFAHAHAGRRVVVVCESRRAIADTIREFESHVAIGSKIVIRRSADHECIEISDRAAISFITRDPDGMRGRSADTVVVVGDIDPKFYHHLRAMIASSPDGEIVRE